MPASSLRVKFRCFVFSPGVFSLFHLAFFVFSCDVFSSFRLALWRGDKTKQRRTKRQNKTKQKDEITKRRQGIR